MSTLSQFGGGVKKVYNGEIQLSAGATSATITIPAVDTSKSVVIFQGRMFVSSGVAPMANVSFGTVTLTNSTTVTAQRAAMNNSTVIKLRFSIIEYK